MLAFSTLFIKITRNYLHNWLRITLQISTGKNGAAMTGNFLTLASTAGVVWGIFQHWNAGASWSFALWSALLLVGVIFYHRAERVTNRTHSPTDEGNFSWTFREDGERPKKR
jgi:hypothetical protein